MIIQKQFLNKLKDFGLNTYESKLWTALLSRGISTAGELSDIANVPRSRTYDVLESLEKKGFIVMKIGKPIKYSAVPPKEVIDRVQKGLKEAADKQSEVLDELKSSDVLEELNLLYSQGVELVEPSDLSGSIKGRNSLNNHLDMMIKGAESSVVIMTTAQGLIRKAEQLRSSLAKAKERGVKVRIAAPLTSKEAQKAADDLKEVADVRHIDEIQSRFCIVDNKNLFFMLLNDKDVHPTYDSGIWVNTEFFTTSLVKMFDSQWKALKMPIQTVKVKN